MTYRVAVIGTGPDPDVRMRDRVSVAYKHAAGYHRSQACDLVACADADRETLETFASTVDIENEYTDYIELLEREQPAIVSICAPPAVIPAVTRGCLETDSVIAVHCNPPFATTWRECRNLVTTCKREAVQLTVHYQNRFSRPVQRTKRLLSEGAIGQLRRIEWSESNLFMVGCHLFDLCGYFTDEQAPQWVLAGVDTDPDNRWFSVLNEVQAIAHWEYEDGTRGFASTAEDRRETLVDSYMRLVGKDGCIEIAPDGGPSLRIRTGGNWRRIDTDGETVYGRDRSWYAQTLDRVASTLPGVGHARSPTQHDRTIEHVVSSLESGNEPLVSGQRALRGMELAFACWESARSRERVDFPLEALGNSLEELCQEKYGRVTDSTQTTAAEWLSPGGEPDG